MEFMKSNTALFAIILISSAIAVVAPFDVAFAAVTFGSPSLRVGLIVAIALIGAYFSRRLGLRLEGHGARSPGLIGIMMAVVLAAYVVALDCYLFRHLLSAEHTKVLETSLPTRMTYFMLRAFNENVIYRLFVFSGLLYLILLARGPKRMTPSLIVAAMVVSQLVNIGINVFAISSEPISFLSLTYDLLRYVVPGVFKACLFWRFGFLTTEVASVGCHIFLQPALGILL
ncbi:hypothetical protein ACO2JO_04295 [Leptospira interrogans]